MIILKRHIFFWIGWIAITLISSLFYFVFAWIEQWTLSLEIIGVGIRHGTPSNVNLWVYGTSSNDQEISGQFSDYFWVEDLEWYVTGHYTTIQCDGVYGSAGNRLTWVYLKAGSTSPILILWATWNVLISSGIYDYVSILNPITYIYKPTEASGNWVINKYWDKPRFKIFIPGGTPAGHYSGTIIFSLYMN